MRRKALIVAAMAVASVLGLQAAQASDLVLNSLQSQANVGYGYTNTGAYSSTSPRSGLYFLYRDGGVDKIQDAVQQTYFYRVGASGTANEINSGTSASLLSSSGSMGATQYTDNNGQFSVKIGYVLTGSGIAGFTNNLGRQILISNTTASPLTMSFWSYSDYTLTGVSSTKPTPGNPYQDNNGAPTVANNGYEFAQVKSAGTVTQWDTYGSPTGPHISDLSNNYGGLYSTGSSVGSPTIQLGLGGGSNVSGTILDKLVNNNPDLTASGIGSQVGGQGAGGIATDVAFAAQWNLTIPAGGYAYLTESTAVVPEPASLALLGLGASLLVWPRRRRA